MTLTELSIKRPILIIVFFAFIGALGIYGFSQLKYDLMPKMAIPVVTITTVYPGASPNEVETSVSKVIEDAVTGIDKVSTVRSSSYEGRSLVAIEFNQDVNIDLAVQDAQRKVNEILLKLPTDAKQPIISKIAFDELPVLRMAVRAKKNPKELYQFVKDQIQPRLSKISGVGSVSMLGGEEREIRVNINAEKLKGYGLSLAGVTNAIKASNMDFPTGNVYADDKQFVVRVAAKLESVEQLSNLDIGKSKSGASIKLKEVADIYDGIKELSNIYRLNGDNSIGVIIQKQNDGNTVEVSKKVREALKQMETIYAPIGLKFDIAQDNSDFIMASADGVKEDLLLAVIIVALVMLMFLHSLRNSLIVMVAIPSSLVSTFFMMFVFGMSLNMMTLLAMSLVIGILVDDSIVVLENIYRHLEMGKGNVDAAITGRNEIGFAALSITLVDVVVFMPLALIVGVIGNLLREYSLVVVFSTLMSLIVSFTVTPMLASRFTKLTHLTKESIFGRIGLFFEHIFDKLTEYYTRVLRWGLANGGKISILTLLLFISSFSLFKFGLIGFEFVPNSDRGELIINLETAPGATIETTNDATQKAERIIASIPDVEKIITNVGASSEGVISMSSSNSTEILVKFVDKKYRKISTDLYGQIIKNKLSNIAGIKTRVSAIGMTGNSNRSPIQILVTGTDIDGVMKGADQIQSVLKKLEGTTDIRLSVEDSKPEFKVDIDRQKLNELGLTIAEVGQSLRIALTGDDDSKFREGVNEYEIRIMLDRFDRTNPDNLKNLTFTNSKGQIIYLNQFANVIQTTGPTKLERENRIRSLTVNSNVFGKTSGLVAQEFEAKMKTTKLPEGVKWEMTGEQKNFAESMQSLLMALTAGILFVYMIMVALYNSFVYPFVVLFSIPLAIVGAFFGLALALKSISIFSMLGMIMLIGLVAKNAILIVDRTNQSRAEENLSVYDALIEAGQTRLRPILMTTLAMVFGMLPIALSTAAGAESKSGLAVVLIGGLTSSLLLTLVIVPLVYQKFDKIRDKFFVIKANWLAKRA
jgi:HAE1 family hydrophobic/amphiphilic exporter-1